MFSAMIFVWFIMLSKKSVLTKSAPFPKRSQIRVTVDLTRGQKYQLRRLLLPRCYYLTNHSARTPEFSRRRLLSLAFVHLIRSERRGGSDYCGAPMSRRDGGTTEARKMNGGGGQRGAAPSYLRHRAHSFTPSTVGINAATAGGRRRFSPRTATLEIRIDHSACSSLR